MDPKYIFSAKRSIASARRRQAILYAFFGVGLFCLTLGSAFAQTINPNAQQLFEQAGATTELNQKIRLLESALQLSPQYIDARVELAKTLIELQQFRRAISQLDTVLSKDLKNAEAWFYKGRAYAGLTEYNTAIRSFKQAISFKKDLPEFYIELGKAQLATQSFDEALQSFQQGLALAISKKDSNTQAEAWYWKGRAHEAKGDTTNAAKSYRQSLLSQPDFKEARISLANLENQTKFQAKSPVDSAKAVPKPEKLDTAAVTLAQKPVAGGVEKKLEPRKSLEQTQPPKSLTPTERGGQKPDSILAESLPSVTKPENGLQSNQPKIKVLEKFWQTSSVKWIAASSIIMLIAALFYFFYRNNKRPVISKVETPKKPVLIETDFLRQKLPRYRIEQRLGEGGMANVYKAFDRDLERWVALKVIRFESTMRNDAIKERISRFIEEAKKTAQFNQENIVRVFDKGDIDGVLLYMIMEFVEGFTVQQMLAKEKPLLIDEAVHIVMATCKALEYAHKRGIIHRDIKPSNIMVNIEGIVKVVDFGIAKILSSDKAKASLTLPGFLVGTPSYMSPEQLSAEALNGRSDIFSLGIVFYEMLAGKHPFIALGFNRVKITKLSVLAWLIFLPCAAGLYGQTFTDIGAPLPDVQFSSVAWGDYDNDNDLDILLTGDSSTVRLSRVYRNEAGQFVDIKAGLVGISNGSVAWGDYDNDEDLDILLSGSLGSSTGISKVYRNDSGKFVDINAPLAKVYGGSVAWGDYDNDGDLDILLSGTASFGLGGYGLFSAIYLNDGRSFEYKSLSLLGASSAAWGDYDNDGDLDILLTGSSITTIYKNNGGTFVEDPAVVLPGGSDVSSVFGDYDNDDDLDILLTGSDNNSKPITKIYRNNTTTKNTAPNAPSNLLSTATGYTVTLSWNLATDSRTRDRALTYNLRLGALPSGVQKVSPMADINTGYRRVVQLGNTNHRNSWTIKNLLSGTYYWSVQAIDNAFAGSAFATEQSFIIPQDGTPPAVPQLLPLTASEREGEVILTWKPNVEIDLAYYRIYRNETPMAATLIDTVAPGFTTYTDKNLVEDGTTYYYRITAVDYAGNESGFSNEVSGTPPLGAFSEMFKISQNLAAVSGGSVAWGDYDDDSDLDMVITGDYPGLFSSAVTEIYRNAGNTFTRTSFGLKGVIGEAVWGDYDNDNDLDLLLTGSGIAKIYRNEPGKFVDCNASLQGVTSSSASWGDYDNDGDLDILLTGRAGSFNIVKIYRNDSRADTCRFVDINAPLVGVYNGSVAWGDYDNDSDLDILLTGSSNSGDVSKVYQNRDTSFFDINAPLIGIEYSSVAWGDYDNDGDLDILLAGNANSGNVSKLYKNDRGNFTEAPVGLPGTSFGAVAWGDYDNDGYLDILLTGEVSFGNYIAKIYRNEGGHFSDIQALLSEGDGFGEVAWGDYDSDGDLDILLNGSYVSKVYRNNAKTANTLPGAPFGLKSIVTGSSVTLSWSKANDNQTAQKGLTYNFRIGTSPNGVQKVSPMAEVQDGFRKLSQIGNANHDTSWTIKNLSPGKYFWSVQAIDNAFAGSAFAQEDTFRITGSNQPPAVANSIPDTTLAVGGISFTRDLNASPKVFNDPNGDALTFTANSSDTTKAKASISGNTLTVAPGVAGNTTITVIAKDGSGAMAQTTFKVIVVNGNLPPVVASAIPNQTLTAGGPPFTRDLNASPAVFIDPNRDALTYSASSSAQNIATASISASTLTVAPVASGSATITVTANDGRGGTKSIAFTATGTGNRPPTVANVIPNQTLTVGGASFTRNLNASPAVFTDPDGDALSYTASSSALSIATANISGSTLTVAPVAVGTAVIKVIANDNKGGKDSTAFTVTMGNRPPVVANVISPITLIVSGAPFTRNLNATPPVFTDLDNDPLTYTASSSITNVATTTIAGSTLTVTPVAAGSATIVVTANDGRGGSAQTTFTVTVNLDSESPKILTVDAVPIVDLSTSIAVSANVTDNIGVQKVKLFYREGGKVAFDSTDMSLSQSLYRATIPSSFAGTRGVEFKIQAADGAKNQVSTVRQSVRVRLPDKHLSKTHVGGSAENAYRLVSFPLASDNPDVNSILLDDLGPADTTKWRVWDINPQTAESDFPYREYPAIGPLLPGKSIFLITKENKTLTSSAGATVITTAPFTIDLKPGWNMIASPFNFDIPIQNVKPDSLRDDLYAYNGAFVSFPNFLKPWEGYMIKVKAPVTLTIQPAETPQSAITKPVVSRAEPTAFAPDWFIRVQATCERASDIDNVIGVVQDAATEWDRHERFEPPPIGKYVMVSFPHRDWQRYPDVYTTDFRPPSSDGHVWDFAVSSNISGKPVTLNFDNFASVPPEYEIKLVDLNLKLSQDLRREAHYTFRSNNSEGKKAFRLLAGKTDFISERSASVTVAPATYELAPNFPNPFSANGTFGNPSTSIKFGLPQKSRVSLRIYDILGKEIATLFNDIEKEAGYHAAIWEGKDRQGNAMPSGIYIYRLLIGEIVLTKKMTLIK